MKIAVVGKMRSGKDTLARFFMVEDGAVKMAFADGIKEISEKYFPELVAQGKPRELYQKVGQYFRSIDPDVWVKYMNRRIALHEAYDEENFVISDVRQMNEYESLKVQGFTVVKVVSYDEIRRARIEVRGDTFNEADFNHETELAVDAIPYDYLVPNNGTYDEFMENIQDLYKVLTEVATDAPAK
jgi:dephospho-CoA kinase